MRPLVARQAAQQAIVLLTNNDQLLPLRNDLTRLAMIGPFVVDAGAMLGSFGFFHATISNITIGQALRG